MTYDELKQLDQQYYMNVFGNRLPVVFTKGEGACLYDDAGKEYIDFLAGIAVNGLGYSDKGFQSALKEQVDSLVHTCNYFYNEPQAKLAQLLCKKTGFSRIFFGNSGAEANECAIKLAKKYAFEKGKNSAKFLTLKNSFHGRTLATLSATGQDKFHVPFQPMTYEFTDVNANDKEAIKKYLTSDICGIILEVIQGEGGVLPLEQEFVQEIRALCDQNDVLMIIDEVQTGMGRTGKLLAQEHYGVKADITTLAKALGNGIPIGACLANEKAASAFHPGDHGSTFGGNPLACAAGLYVTQKLDEAMLTAIAETGAYFKKELIQLMKELPDKIIDVRGEGLLLGAELSTAADAHAMQKQLLDIGFVIGTAGANTLRFAPPFIIMQKQVDSLVGALHRLLQ